MVRQLPSHLSYILHRLSESGRSFIELYGGKEKRMQTIAGELNKIYEEVNKLQKSPHVDVMIFAVFGGFGIVLFSVLLLGHRLFGGEGAATMAILGLTMAFGGVAMIVHENVIRAMTEKVRIRAVEQLLREFMTFADQLKDVLEEINMVSEALEEKSSSLTTRTGAQAKTALLNTKQLREYLRRAAELAEGNHPDVEPTLERGLRELFYTLFNIHPIPGRGEELRNCVIFSVYHCRITVDGFVRMRATLKDFEEMQPES